MSTNSEILRKADITIADLASSGALPAEEANKFIRRLIEAPTLLAQVRAVEMGANTKNVNRIRFGTRILKPATSATALAVGDRSKPSTDQIQLSTDEVIAEVRLPYDVIEDNIEKGNIGQATDAGGTEAGGGFVDTIITLIAERTASDLEELAIQGDSTSGDAFLALQDGFVKTIEDDGTTSDANGATISKQVLKGGIKALDDKHKGVRGAMRHYVTMSDEIEYMDTVADRGTTLGDTTLSNVVKAYAHGIPVEGIQWMPSTKGILTHPKNLLWGIQRNVMMEFDKDISARVYIIVVTARVAINVEEEEAAVVYNNIAA